MVALSPIISIGMPVYNGQAFIESAIKSILEQTFEDFELILSDNASNDKTQEICLDYKQQDNRIRYFRNEVNLGAAQNYNHVFGLSKGKYFKWAAHDDLCNSTFLFRCVEVLDNDPSVVLCYPKTVLIDVNGNVIENYEDNLALFENRPHQRLAKFVRNVRLCNPVFGLLRASVLSRTRLIDKFVSSDEVLLAELALMGKFFECSERLFLRRMHSQSSWESNESPQEKARWFDPNSRSQYVMRRNRLFFEILKSIKQSKLPFSEQIKCGRVFISEWLRLHWLEMGSENKAAIKKVIRNFYLQLNHSKV